MPTCEITLKGVQVKDAQQAETLRDSFQQIANTLSAKDVIDLAALLKAKPGIVQQAKSFLHL
jgi:hypothetical protein